MVKSGFIVVLALAIFATQIIPQSLPKTLRSYLDRNYRGWKLAGQCYDKEKDNKKILVGNFNGDGKRDYAVKFVRGEKGFLMAFLADGRMWKPYYLHIYSAREAKYSDLMLFRNGESFEPAETPKLKFDSPADFHCDSDVGGVHTFYKGRFIAY